MTNPLIEPLKENDAYGVLKVVELELFRIMKYYRSAEDRFPPDSICQFIDEVLEATHKTVEEKWAEEKGLPPEELEKD